MFRWLVLVLVVCAYAAPTASAARPRDRDHDGLPDRWEHRYHLAVAKKSARSDPDHDRLNNLREYRLRTNPRRKDTDGDGLSDGVEVRRYHTNPRKKDTDGDGIRDRAEVHRYHTNPRKKDTDGDGYSDAREIRASTSPTKKHDHPKGGGGSGGGGGGSTTPPTTPMGFPGTANTGVPSGTSLSAYTGPSTISTPGTVIDGKSMGCITVSAPGVVIRNSKISCSGSYAIYVKDGGFTGTPLLVEDSTIDCKTTNKTGIGEANFTVRRADISRCENGGDLNQNILIEDSYIHDLASVGTDPHEDGLQLAWGHFEGGTLVDGARDITIRHNTIYGITTTGSFGTSAIISNGGNAGIGPDRNILIQSNLLAGGAVALYCDQGSTAGINFRVLDNHFSTQFKSTVGYYGLSSGCRNETQSGNVIDETGAAVTLP